MKSIKDKIYDEAFDYAYEVVTDAYDRGMDVVGVDEEEAKVSVADTLGVPLEIIDKYEEEFLAGLEDGLKTAKSWLNSTDC